MDNVANMWHPKYDISSLISSRFSGQMVANHGVWNVMGFVKELRQIMLHYTTNVVVKAILVSFSFASLI